MLYREAGQFKTSYAADQAVFPLRQDRIGIGVILFIAFVVIPLTGNDFMLNAVMIPVLIFALAAIGLNILTGYTGLISLGTGGFMGVGAYACYKLTTDLPGVNIIIWILASGFFSAAVGVAVRPAVAAHQGLLSRGRDARGAVLPVMVLHPRAVALQLQRLRRDRGAAAHVVRRHRSPGRAPRPRRAIYVVLAIVVADDLARLQHRARPHRAHVDGGARHGHRGRADRHPALPTKLLAFAVSSFYCGVAGALMVFLWLGAAEADRLQHQPSRS